MPASGSSNNFVGEIIISKEAAGPGERGKPPLSQTSKSARCRCIGRHWSMLTAGYRTGQPYQATFAELLIR